MATVLVVEDEPGLREVIAEVVAEAGHTAVPAIDGLTARELLASFVPDLVITDTMMPRLSGPNLVRWMRRQPALQDVPVILTSAAPPKQIDDLERITFLEKPFDLDTIVRLIDQMVL